MDTYDPFSSRQKLSSGIIGRKNIQFFLLDCIPRDKISCPQEKNAQGGDRYVVGIYIVYSDPNTNNCGESVP